MQLILNLLYTFISSFFALIGPVVAPAWFFSFVTSALKYFVIANYFIPLGTFFTVALSCLGFHAFVSGIVIVLDLF